MDVKRLGIVVFAGVVLVGCQASVSTVQHEYGRETGELRAGVVESSTEGPECEEDSRRIVEGLNTVAADFRASGPEIPVERLVELDARIRELVNSRNARCWDDKDLFDEAWDEIGIRLGYNVNLEYSGVLLRRAHGLDPHSEYRSSTLFSTIRDDERTSFQSVPNLRACRRYETEFPDGPFAKNVFEAVASVHKEIFMILREGESGDRWDCLSNFSELKPREFRSDRAQRLALEYYNKALAIDPTDERVRVYRDTVADGTVNMWHYCGC